MRIHRHRSKQRACVQIKSQEESIQLGSKIESASPAVYLRARPRARKDGRTIRLEHVRGGIAVQDSCDVGLPLRLAFGVIVSDKETVPCWEVRNAGPKSWRGADAGSEIHLAVLGEVLDARYADFVVGLSPSVVEDVAAPTTPDAAQAIIETPRACSFGTGNEFDEDEGDDEDRYDSIRSRHTDTYAAHDLSAERKSRFNEGRIPSHSKTA